MGYMRHDKHIEIETLETKAPKKRKLFVSRWKWIKLPRHWVSSLAGAKSAGSTYELAIIILIEAFKRKPIGRKLILTSKATNWMPTTTRKRAVKELVELGLIQIEQDSHKAPTVSHIL